MVGCFHIEKINIVKGGVFTSKNGDVNHIDSKMTVHMCDSYRKWTFHTLKDRDICDSHRTESHRLIHIERHVTYVRTYVRNLT